MASSAGGGVASAQSSAAHSESRRRRRAPMDAGGTVKGPNTADFDPEKLAEMLKKAFKGLGTDERVVIDIVGSHTNWQRQEIKKKYKSLFGKDLLRNLEDELGGHFLDAVLALMCPSHMYDAHCLRKSIVGLGTDENCLIEILCSRSNSELQLVREAYYQEFKRSLEKDINGDTSGVLRKVLLAILNARRDESGAVEAKVAEKDAVQLQAAGVAKVGTDEDVFTRILCSRSWPQLKATFEAYRRRTDRDIETDIRKEFSGDVRDALISIVKYAKSPHGYFADKLHESMRGAGTDDSTLIRIIVSRSEIDLLQIKEEYQKHFKKTLKKSVREDCSGDYARLLLKILE